MNRQAIRPVRKANMKLAHRPRVRRLVMNSSKSSPVNTSLGGPVVEGRTVQHDGVNIKSSISSDVSSTVSVANQQKLNDLVSKLGRIPSGTNNTHEPDFPLGSTHTQIDQYSKKQSEKINDQIQGEIDQVVTRTRLHQEELLRRANEHTAQIDAEYRARLQKMVEEVDTAKAKRIAEIETELNKQQADILQGARSEIDQLNQKAATLKIGVLHDAQVKAAANADAITAEATSIGQTSTLHQSKGTTTIKTEVSAASTTKDTAGSTSGSATTHETHASSAQDKSGTKTTETTRVQTQQKKWFFSFLFFYCFCHGFFSN